MVRVLCCEFDDCFVLFCFFNCGGKIRFLATCMHAWLDYTNQIESNSKSSGIQYWYTIFPSVLAYLNIETEYDLLSTSRTHARCSCFPPSPLVVFTLRNYCSSFDCGDN